MNNAKPFFVMGLPRSRTAWMSVFLSTGIAICLHEPLSRIASINDLPKLLESPLHDYVGISDSGLGFWSDWLVASYPTAPIVVIERDIIEVENSLAALGFPPSDYCSKLMESLMRIRYAPKVLWLQYHQLGSMHVAQRIFRHCLPGVPFDEMRWIDLEDMSIEVRPDAVVRKISENRKNVISLFGPVGIGVRDERGVEAE